MANTKARNASSSDSSEHAVKRLIDAVDASHPGLGALAGISVVSAKARQCLMVVGPPGTGKSAVARWLGEKLPEAYVRGDLTMAALRKFNDELSNSTACIVIEDLGEANSEWNRAQTCIGISALVYGHEMLKDTTQIKVEIIGFYGSGWIGLQPSIMAEVVKHPSFHANLRDKSLRYYHLTRPTAPNFGGIEVEIPWGLAFDEVAPLEEHPALWETLVSMGRIEWSFARAQEHISGLLRALAALDNRYGVDSSDYELLLALMKPTTIEQHVIEKQGFDSAASLHQNLLCLLSEFCSYPIVTYEIIGADYGIRPSKVQRILEDMHDYFYKVRNNPVVLVPTELLKQIQEEAGYR